MDSRRNSNRQIRTRAGRLAPSKRWPSEASPATGKANYRPMTSISRKPSLLEEQPSRQGSISNGGRNAPLETMPEGTSQPASIHPSDSVPTSKERYYYHQSSDPKVMAEMAVITNYIKEKNLMSSMMSCCQLVLRENNLPYNPYPQFVTKMRQNAERFHMFSKSTRTIQAQLKKKLHPTTTQHIYGVKGHNGAWGLDVVLSSISPQALKQFDWLIEDVAPSKVVLSDEQTEYSGQVVVAMVGPSVFSGTLYQEAPSLDIRIEYVIYGPSLQEALLIFNNCVSDDIRRMVSTECPHKIIGIKVPGTRPSDSTPQPGDFWTIAQARGEWDDFWDGVGDAVKSKQPITIQCVFLLDKEQKVYRAGSKQFVLHFVQTSENSSNEKFTSFAELPYLTLYEGFFFKKAHADAYLMTLKRLDIEGVTELQRGQSMEDSLLSLQEEVRNDGSDLVYANAVTEPIREHWQRQMAKLHPVRDSFLLSHLALLLTLLDRSDEGSEVKLELYRYLHSTAASWHTAMSLNTTLQLLAVTFKEKEADAEDQDFLTGQFMEYKKKLLTVIDPELHSRSSELLNAHSILSKLLIQMLLPDPTVPNKFIIKSLDLRKLRYVQDYCMSIQLVLMEDAMVFFKRIQFEALVKGCRAAFEDDGNPKSVKSTKNRNKKGTASSSLKIKHGVESKEINQQTNRVLNVDEVKQRSNWPGIMVTEAVLMQYMVDIKLDVIWHGYILELLTGNHLPPNPYPRLVTLLRHCALRMRLCADTISTITTKLLRPAQTKLVDRSANVYGIPSVGAFCLSQQTLAAVDADPGAYMRIVKLTERLANREVVARKGQFQVSVSQAVGQNCALYGRLVPYLNTLHLYEHYYIRGTIGADTEAIQLYAKLVYDYIASIPALNVYIVIGVYFNEFGRFMSEADFRSDKALFISHMVDAARKKQDIFLKLYQPVGWRYICIQKHFVLHYLFVDNTDDRHECYSPSDPSAMYQYIFQFQDEASAHYRGSGAIQLGNPKNPTVIRSVNSYLRDKIEGAIKEHRMMNAYQLILQKALINSDKKQLVEAWRVHHSLAFQLEYLQTINRDIQALVRYALTSPEKLFDAPSIQSLTKGRGSNNKTETDSGNQKPFNKTTLAKFITVYSDKLTSTLQEPCSFTPAALLELIREKLATLVAVDDQTKGQSVIIDRKTVTTLGEIFQLLQPVQDWTAYDAHQAITEGGSLSV
ncbi:uncharacterized protein LOC117290809 isoform X1 [Asterias rubens]|uniref:uncharacterized protein LOC117290809 isoform X1 n=1 Tax=Asterias rubens TaxID=7604 RepID=UPI0014556346|nr:uncharacterized protein LOC117290809 isoform X1 [Asterias rubens]